MTIRTLTDTLRTIAYGGADAFYKGQIAERVAAFTQERGGWLTTEDLAEHAPSWEEPISASYRGVWMSGSVRRTTRASMCCWD